MEKPMAPLGTIRIFMCPERKAHVRIRPGNRKKDKDRIREAWAGTEKAAGAQTEAGEDSDPERVPRIRDRIRKVLSANGCEKGRPNEATP